MRKTLLREEYDTGLPIGGEGSYLDLSFRNSLPAKRATAIIAQFQKAGSVPNLALTLGTRRYLCEEYTSGRLYSQAGFSPMPLPKSTILFSVMGSSSFCNDNEYQSMLVRTASVAMKPEQRPQHKAMEGQKFF